MPDVIVVGGGPAGRAAAMMLGRSHRSVLLVDSGEPRNARATHVHNALTRDGTPPAEWRRIVDGELAAYPSLSRRSGTVTAVSAAVGGISVTLGPDRVTARRLLLATGVVDELPPVLGLPELWGRSVFHCPYCHGWETNGTRIGVLGGTAARARLALQLRRFSDDVTLFTDGSVVEAAAASALAAAGVSTVCVPLAAVEGEEGRLVALRLTDGTEAACDALFVAPTTRQRSSLAAELGCEMLPTGAVRVDALGRTSNPAVFAAGDMAHVPGLPGPLASVTAAAAAGQAAAGAIDQELLTEEHGV